MITFKRFKCESIYGGSYYMDNSYKILSNNEEIGTFYFPNHDNCEVELAEGEMYLEYIELFNKGLSREVFKAISKEFSIRKIIGETSDEKKSYWAHIGAEVDESYADEEREMYNFNLAISNL